LSNLQTASYEVRIRKPVNRMNLISFEWLFQVKMFNDQNSIRQIPFKNMEKTIFLEELPSLNRK